MLSTERHGDGVLLSVTCRCGGTRSSVTGRCRHSRCSRRRRSQCTSCCCGGRGGRLGTAGGSLEEGTTSDAARRIRHRGLRRRTTATSAAAPLLLLLLLLKLLEQRELLHLLLQLLLPTSSTTSSTLLLLIALLALLLLRCRLLWRSSATISTDAFATSHPGRRAVVGVEEDGVLEGAEARASLGPQSAVVTVPRGLRSRILERQVGRVSVRRAGRAPFSLNKTY